MLWMTKADKYRGKGGYFYLVRCLKLIKPIGFSNHYPGSTGSQHTYLKRPEKHDVGGSL